MTTDVMQGDLSNQEQPVNNDVVQQTQEPTKQASFTQDDSVPKSRVEEIVHERTRKAADNAYQKGLMEAEARQRATGSFGGMSQVTEQKLREMMQSVFQEQHAELNRKFQEDQTRQQIQQLANDYMGKLEASKDKYPELLKRRDEIGEFSHLIPFINETDEVAGITQHLLENGHNVASLLVLQQTSPTFLRRELKKLAESIKQNDSAKNRQYPHEPLNSITPSAYTVDNDSTDSIEALKKQSWLRG